MIASQKLPVCMNEIKFDTKTPSESPVKQDAPMEHKKCYHDMRLL